MQACSGHWVTSKTRTAGKGNLVFLVISRIAKCRKWVIFYLLLLYRTSNKLNYIELSMVTRLLKKQLISALAEFWKTWWRHQMETFSALLAICAGNSLVSGEFPAQRPVTRSFDVFFDVRVWVNTREAGHLRRCRIHYDVIVMDYVVILSLLLLPYCHWKLLVLL